MGKTIAISGKGGVGKTTIAALIIKYLISRGKVVLAVDADPNYNLHEKLGISITKSIGQFREDMLKNIDSLPMTKPEYVEYQIRSLINESEKIDLLVMGRPEGPGCYCYVNSLLRQCIDNLSEKYNYIVIDCEAGMEHLSRRTTRDVEIMYIVTDPTIEGARTVKRIENLAFQMDLKINKVVRIVNKVEIEKLKIGTYDLVLKEIGDYKLIPYDENISSISVRCEPLLNISRSKSYDEIEKIVSLDLGI